MNEKSGRVRPPQEKRKIMGLTFLTIEVGNPANPEKTVPIKFLVDSGAIYAVVPSHILEELGIVAIKTKEFRLANGETITRKIGGALYRYKDDIGVSEVIFGEENDSTLLGAFALESLGLALNPLSRELMPIPMMLAMKHNAPDAIPDGKK
jgi:clan AA aspartic protease